MSVINSRQLIKPSSGISMISINMAYQQQRVCNNIIVARVAATRNGAYGVIKLKRMLSVAASRQIAVIMA